MPKVILVWLALTGVAAADRVQEEPTISIPPSQPNAGFAPRRRPVVVPQPPRPAPQIVQLGTPLAGTWTCKGFAIGSDSASQPVKETRTIVVALDGAWIETTIARTSGGHTAKLVEARTYDAVSKQWTAIGFASSGAYTIATSLGEQNGVWQWTSSAMTVFEQATATTIKTWTERASKKLSETTCSR